MIHSSFGTILSKNHPIFPAQEPRKIYEIRRILSKWFIRTARWPCGSCWHRAEGRERICLYHQSKPGRFLRATPISHIPVGSDVIYSCLAFILLGKILEKAYGKPLDVLLDELVCKPLCLNSTCFCPQSKTNIVNSNLDETQLGIVNDFNCQHLGGVAGNAGVFSNINDITDYVTMLIKKGYPIISKNTFEKATRNYTAKMAESRGLGYLYVDERYPQTGNLFPVGSIGHCGHTGQSVFVDLKSGLYVIILSDATISIEKKYGRSKYEEVMQMRTDIHNAIKKDFETSI